MVLLKLSHALSLCLEVIVAFANAVARPCASASCALPPRLKSRCPARHPGHMEGFDVPDLPAELPALDPGLVHIDVAAPSEEDIMELSRRSAAAPFAALHARDRMPGIPANREAQVTGA